ncbi:MAG: DNA polymerase III subunit alpha [Chlorobi bacterium]|nr:DNA polymerase III subunit alpha [Chlorobiota bacterium]
MYINCHSNFSLRYGTLPVEKLVKLAKEYSVPALALTDINNSSAMLDFVKICKNKGIKPIAGIEIRNGNKYLYTGIAKNNEGFRELNEFVSRHNFNKKEYQAYAEGFNDVYIIYPFNGRNPEDLRGNEFIGIKPHEVLKLFTSPYFRDRSKLIIQQPVTFADKEGYFIHKNLRAIDNNILLSQLTPEMLAGEAETLIPVDELLAFYRDYPQIIKNTEKFIDECEIDFDYKSLKNKKTFTDDVVDDKTLLRKLAFDGLDYRYGMKNKTARERVEKELGIIFKLGFAAYFLIAWDIIRYSMSRGFYHVGRGSGANSVVAYCLKITDVDPIDLDLYFERFLNPKRTSPPDFDIDYSWRDREEVQDYIFKRYGHEHTALLGATSTFKRKSILRELGKVYGLPKTEIDELVDNTEKSARENSIAREIVEISRNLTDFPNIRSIHAGGILISEKPLTYYTALDLPPKGFPTTQWDMYVAEDFGFEKLDILSQRGIGHIRDAAEIILENRGIRIDVHQIDKFKKDKKVRAQLKRGETIGCFYVESPAMRGLLNKLRCDNYLSLVAASSIIRPGVAKSGMMREYIHRFHNPDKFEYLHPVMKEQLQETFGVMVYQEDVLKVCHHFADLDLSDADVLRRAMSGKFRGGKEMKRIVGKFFGNCKEKGYSDELTKEVWRQIESFAGYSFSKAHSASYAVESFQSLFLKAWFPLEFMVAVINNFGGFYHTWVYFGEAKYHGANIELPCVNHSNYLTHIIGKDIYVGFVHIANLENKAGKKIRDERQLNGNFNDLEDFIRRVDIGLDQLIILIRTDAFRFTGKQKAELLWEAHLFLNKGRQRQTGSLFYASPRKYKLPKLEQSPVANAYDEIEFIGFPVSMSYFDLLKTPFRGEITAKDLIKYVGKRVRMLGHLVTVKYVRTVRKELMHFGTFLDVNGEFFDTVHFPNSLRNYPFRGNGLYLILGLVTAEFDFPSLTVEKLAKLPLKGDPRE